MAEEEDIMFPMNSSIHLQVHTVLQTKISTPTPVTTLSIPIETQTEYLPNRIGHVNMEINLLVKYDRKTLLT